MRSLFWYLLSAGAMATAQTAPQTLYTLTSPTQRSDGQFGEAVNDVGGDINGDGVPDVIVGGRGEYPLSAIIKSGRAHLYSGANGSLMQTLVSPNPEYWGFFGSSVDGLGGDVNGDSIPDVIVGAPYENPGATPVDAGRAYVFSGADGSVLYTVVSPLDMAGGQFGTVVSGLDGPGYSGDLNGDGIPDLLVSAPYETSGASPANAGRVHLFSGADGTLLYSVQSANEEAVSAFGWSASGIGGDANSDGIPDFIVGAYLEDPGSSPSNSGRAYLFSGADGTLLQTLQSPFEQKDGFFGRSVSGAGGDLNGDGSADVLVGAIWETADGNPGETGRAYAFNGADGSLLLVLETPDSTAAGWFGSAVAGPGTDANADGIPDVLVSAPKEGEVGGLNAESGRAYLFSGADGSILQTILPPGLEPDAWFGQSMSGTGGDVDGDGVRDFLIGAERQDIGSAPTNAGSAHVFSGRGLTCTPIFAPTGLSHFYSPSRVYLQWIPPVATVGCQVQGKRLPTGPTPSVNVLSPSYNLTSVPFSLAGAGSTWTWRVRCACSLSPLEVTPFSDYTDTFAIPVHRETLVQQESNWHIYPNPAVDFLYVEGAADGALFQLHDVSGALRQSGKLSGPISLEALESGWYTLTLDGSVLSFIRQ